MVSIFLVIGGKLSFYSSLQENPACMHVPCGADFELIPCAIKEMGDLNAYNDEWSGTVTINYRAIIHSNILISRRKI